MRVSENKHNCIFMSIHKGAFNITFLRNDKYVNVTFNVYMYVRTFFYLCLRSLMNLSLVISLFTSV